MWKCTAFPVSGIDLEFHLFCGRRTFKLMPDVPYGEGLELGLGAVSLFLKFEIERNRMGKLFEQRTRIGTTVFHFDLTSTSTSKFTLTFIASLRNCDEPMSITT